MFTDENEKLKIEVKDLMIKVEEMNLNIDNQEKVIDQLKSQSESE